MCVTLCSYLQRSAKNAEALRSEVDELMGHLNHLDQIVQERNLLAQRVRELVAEVERLRSERDESQRLLVEARQANVNQTQATHATLRLVLLRSSLRIDPPRARAIADQARHTRQSSFKLSLKHRTRSGDSQHSGPSPTTPSIPAGPSSPRSAAEVAAALQSPHRIPGGSNHDMPGVAEAQEIEDEVDDAAVAAAIAAVEQAHRSDEEAPTATGDTAAVPATTSAAEANNGK